MNEITIFNYEEKEIRTVRHEGSVWWVLKDVCDTLELANARVVAERLDDDEVSKFDLRGLSGETWIVNESGLYNVILRSDKPQAKPFKRWLTHDVLPEIRKTGGYNARNEKTEIEREKIKIQKAKTYIEISKISSLPDNYRNILAAKAAEELNGKMLIELPKSDRRTYSAGEIGEMLGGISANKIGRLANEHALKTDEYGQFYHDKSPHSAKEVETFRYFDSAVDRFKQLIEN